MSQAQGFTLIELVVAILIIAILSVVGLSSLRGVQERGQDERPRENLEFALRTAKAVYADGENFPVTDLAGILERADRNRTVVSGTGFATEQIAVERINQHRLVLRSRSRAGRRFLIDLDEQNSRVIRAYGKDGNVGLERVTNLLDNPSFETNTTGWASDTGSGTLTRSAGWAAAGSGRWSLHVDDNSAGNAKGVRFATVTGLSAGQTYSVRATVNLITNSATGARGQIDWYNSSGTQLGSSWGGFATGTGEANLTVSGTAPATADRLRFRFYSYDATSDRIEFHIDAVAVTQGSPATGAVDGDSPGGEWSGTPNASSSTAYAGAQSWAG